MTETDIQIITPKRFSACSIVEQILDSVGQFVLIKPLHYLIEEGSWFPKMQLPFLRVPGCGLAIASETDLASASMQPYLWTGKGAPGHVMMAPRATLKAIARAVPTDSTYDYADALYLAAKSLGLVTYVIPGVPITHTSDRSA